MLGKQAAVTAGLFNLLTFKALRHASADRFGTEHEKLGYYTGTHKRLEYSAIRQLLEGLVSRYSWTPIMEGTYIIGVEKDGQSVTIEPGGQFELSGAPLSSVHDTRAETQAHLDQVWLVLLSVGHAVLQCLCIMLCSGCQAGMSQLSCLACKCRGVGHAMCGCQDCQQCAGE